MQSSLNVSSTLVMLMLGKMRTASKLDFPSMRSTVLTCHTNMHLSLPPQTLGSSLQRLVVPRPGIPLVSPCSSRLAGKIHLSQRLRPRPSATPRAIRRLSKTTVVVITRCSPSLVATFCRWVDPWRHLTWLACPVTMVSLSIR